MLRVTNLDPPSSNDEDPASILVNGREKGARPSSAKRIKSSRHSSVRFLAYDEQQRPVELETHEEPRPGTKLAVQEKIFTRDGGG